MKVSELQLGKAYYSKKNKKVKRIITAIGHSSKSWRLVIYWSNIRKHSEYCKTSSFAAWAGGECNWEDGISLFKKRRSKIKYV